MKAFSFLAHNGLIQIGIEYQGDLYNFSRAWDYYKQLKNNGKGPDLGFLQVMVEADFLQLDTLQEVLFALREVRSIDDLKLKEPVQFLPPVGRPQKILCIGRNYREHAEELGNAAPSEPLFFAKSPSSLIAHGRAIHLPNGIGRVDYEGELALVIGKRTSHVAESKALDYVAGYSLLNDVTARDIQRADQKAGRPWFRSKSFDTFCPLGPFLTPTAAVHDIGQLQLEVRVNGDVRQSASASSMIFHPAEVVSYLSRYCTLEAGDVIATGTPAGVGEISPGDRVEVEILEIGCLQNPVKEAKSGQ